MFITLLAVTFVIALAMSTLVALLFRKPIFTILSRLVTDELQEALPVSGTRDVLAFRRKDDRPAVDGLIRSGRRGGPSVSRGISEYGSRMMRRRNVSTPGLMGFGQIADGRRFIGNGVSQSHGRCRCC